MNVGNIYNFIMISICMSTNMCSIGWDKITCVHAHRPTLLVQVKTAVV